MRINEPFGDVVNWDLIPQSAIASMQLIPGSNPAFGLNTLGGALAIYTKSGSNNPGGSLEVYGGSFGRRAVGFEQGGKNGNWDYFMTGNLLHDQGWAEHNPSRVKQFFGKLGLSDRRHRSRPELNPGRQHAGGHADAAAFVSRYPPGIHLS